MTRDDLMEGEGSFMRGPPSAPNAIRISLSMTDRDVVSRVAALWELQYLSIKRNGPSYYKRCYQLILRGLRAAVLMKRLRPLMGERRQGQIDRALRSFIPRRAGDNTRKLKPKQVRTLRKRMASESLLRLSKEFGVSRVTLRRIRDGQIWKEVA